jgi:hypothetical protein
MTPERFALHLQTYRGILPDAVLAYAESLATTDKKRHDIVMYLEEQTKAYGRMHELKDAADEAIVKVKRGKR